MVDNATDAELFARVKTVLQKVIYTSASLDGINSETRLQEDLDMDSVRVVDLVLGLEDEFSIRIDDDAIEKIKTTKNLIDLVKSKLI